MKNNWKEAFKALFDSHNEDERYAEMYFEFIEYLLAEQKKEIIEDILQWGEELDYKMEQGIIQYALINGISLKHHD